MCNFASQHKPLNLKLKIYFLRYLCNCSWIFVCIQRRRSEKDARNIVKKNLIIRDIHDNVGTLQTMKKFWRTRIIPVAFSSCKVCCENKDSTPKFHLNCINSLKIIIFNFTHFIMLYKALQTFTSLSRTQLRLSSSFNKLEISSSVLIDHHQQFNF